jgi:sugar lactone lactonase YvrE
VKTSVFLDQLRFPEGPRWHDGRLYFSDMHAREVIAAGLDGKTQVVARVADDEPSGLGFLPDGRLLVVSMERRRLLRLDPGGLTEAADLSGLAAFHCNDMVVDGAGRAYVGNLGSDVNHGAEVVPADLILIAPGQAPRVAARELRVPNGCVVTPDGRTLIVAESMGARLTAFRIADDGSLLERRVWAELPGAVPDGICLDAEGAIWVASPLASEVFRVREDGRITHRLPMGRLALACMLGGRDGRTLFLCSAESAEVARAGRSHAARTGRIDTVEVEVPRAGWP